MLDECCVSNYLHLQVQMLRSTHRTEEHVFAVMAALVCAMLSLAVTGVGDSKMQHCASICTVVFSHDTECK